jgi:hypothetical protein
MRPVAVVMFVLLAAGLQRCSVPSPSLSSASSRSTVRPRFQSSAAHRLMQTFEPCTHADCSSSCRR